MKTTLELAKEAGAEEIDVINTDEYSGRRIAPYVVYSLDAIQLEAFRTLIEAEQASKIEMQLGVFDDWASRTFGENFISEDPITYFRTGAAWEKALTSLATVAPQDPLEGSRKHGMEEV